MAKVTDFGAVGNGDPSYAARNTAAFAGAIGTGEDVEVPKTLGGYVVTNGELKINTANQSIRGYANMGSTPEWGPTSAIVGQGRGHTLTVSQGGCSVQGLAFKGIGQQESDASLLITTSQIMLRDLHFSGINVGISMQMPWQVGGEFWLQDILMQDGIGVAGIIANCGNSALHMDHVLMFAADPQPDYGIAIPSAGAVIMSACDIDNMGTCLALIPGMDEGRPQNVSAVMISDSYFDNGNGPGCVFIQPQGTAWVQNVRFTNVWTSTVNNNGGQWSTDGFHFDGTRANPGGGVRPITDVTLMNSLAQNFLRHDGIYAIGVTGLKIIGNTFGGNFNGIQIGGPAPGMACSGVVEANCSGNYASPPLNGPMPGSGGNQAYGLLIQGSPLMAFPPTNLLDGNGAGPILVLP